MAYTVAFKKEVKREIWHTSEPKPKRFTVNGCEDIEYITADGQELGWILGQFVGIPRLRMDDKPIVDTSPRGYAMTWYGDIAKFIVANL